MTRLRTEWITHMLDGMEQYNRDLEMKTGLDLPALMRSVFDISADAMDRAKSEKKIAVVPVTQGEGIITCFSQSVAAIIQSTGFQADVMPHTDVDGIYDAVCGGYDIVFLADDTRYLALNIKNGAFSDNNFATALGFVHVLMAMMGKRGVEDPRREKILQIGCGIVGKEAVQIMKKLGLDFDLYDKDPAATSGFKGNILHSKEEIKHYRYILDFTNEGQWLHTEDLCSDVLYASPGVPYSMDEKAANCFASHSVHDNLEIGTAMMLAQSLELR